MTRCLVLQHLDVEGPYAIGDSLRARGIDLAVCRADRGEPPPESVEGLDGVVVMGGPMGAHSDDGFPSRLAELALLRAALSGAVPVLGICLGAQLLAVAAGGRAYRGSGGVEIGWETVTLTPAAADDPLLAGLPARLEVFQWHGDTVDLPPGATLLAGSDRYPHQAFRTGSAWGLQFHPEVTVEAVDSFTTRFAEETARHGIAAESLTGPAAAGVARLTTWRDVVFGRFAELVVRTSTRRPSTAGSTHDQRR